MRRVAFLSFDWNYEIMSDYYEGVQSWLAEHDGVQVVIFNAFGQYANYDPEEGAFEVFSLCNYAYPNGVILPGWK